MVRHLCNILLILEEIDFFEIFLTLMTSAWEAFYNIIILDFLCLKDWRRF